MSLNSISSVAATSGVQRVEAPSTSSATDKIVPFSTGTASAGAYMAQGGGGVAPTSGGSSLLKKVLAGTVVGAGLGFGASFLCPVIKWLPQSKVMLTAIGAGVGAVGGLAMHFISSRRQSLAMQQQNAAQQQEAPAPTTVTQGGATLRMGARGPAAKKLQNDLHALGIYNGKLTGAFDSATSAAVRKYEVMKGVVPTGQGSPEVRAAVAQDVSLMRQYA